MKQYAALHLFQTLTSVQIMEARVTKTRSVLTRMARTLVFAKVASQEMEQYVLVNYALKSCAPILFVALWLLVLLLVCCCCC